MKGLKRPEIKLPEAKVPGFLSDLFRDLRDRHLLPLVGLLLIAIVVVPFALSSSGESDSGGGQAVANGTGAATGSVSDGPHGTTFADSVTGLRDYRRRLHDLSAKDPFKQQYTNPAADGSGGVQTSPGAVASGSSATTLSTGALPSSSPVPSGGSGGGGSGEGSTVKVETKYASYEIDVRIVGAGSGNGGTASATGSASAKGGVRVRRGLPELTTLPDRGTPAAIFMGVSADSKKALLLVSSDVRAVFGDARCLVGSRSCQLLALEPGLPETFVYGARGKTFRIELLKIHRVLSRHPHRASLGG
jgi:hypothetical protein